MIKPYGAMILIKQEDNAEKKTTSGLVISAGFADTGMKTGKIIDLGDGEYNYKGDLIPVNGLDIDNVVMYQEHSALDVEDTDGTKYKLVNAKNILAVIE
jgi:co-chaperonin GroES (HSP10)